MIILSFLQIITEQAIKVLNSLRQAKRLRTTKYQHTVNKLDQSMLLSRNI